MLAVLGVAGCGRSQCGSEMSPVEQDCTSQPSVAGCVLQMTASVVPPAHPCTVGDGDGTIARTRAVSIRRQHLGTQTSQRH